MIILDLLIHNTKQRSNQLSKLKKYEKKISYVQTLREECMKLQQRVQDLELQNQQLNHMFQQRVRFPSDSALQVCGCLAPPFIVKLVCNQQF